MPSLIASTVRFDSNDDEYNDDRTETDSNASISAYSTGSYDKSGVTNSEEIEAGPPSPTLSAASNTTLQYDVSEDVHAETGETVMAFVPCNLYPGHYHLMPIRLLPNPTIEQRKVWHYILNDLRIWWQFEKQSPELV